MRKWIMVSIVVALLGIGSFFFVRSYEPLQTEDPQVEYQPGVPDVVSSISSNGMYYLVVVANDTQIEDRNVFAETVIRMCLKNSFQSVKFSFEDVGYPKRLEVDVYLNREDVKRGSILFKVKYEPEDIRSGWDTKSNPEKFFLTIEPKNP